MQGCMAIISIVSELICVFVKRGGEYHFSCWNQCLVWCGCSHINAADFSCLFCRLFVILFLLSRCCLSPLFSPELLDSWGKSSISFSSSPACQSQHGGTSHPTSTFMVILCRQSCELPPSQPSNEKLCVFLFGCGSSDPALSPTPPPSLSSVFCASPSSWNITTSLARKIGHPLVLLSPPQHSKNNPLRCPVLFCNVYTTGF